MASQSRTLNGTTPVTIFGRTFDWNGGTRYEEIVNVFADTPGPDSLSLTLRGDWRSEAMVLNSSDRLDVTLRDLGGFREIDTLRLFEGQHSVDLDNTRIEHILQYTNTAASRTVLNLGAQETRSIRLSQGDDRVTLGTGRVDSIDTERGNDVVNAGNGGQIRALYLGEGRDVFNGSRATESRVDSLVTFDGGDTINVNRTDINYLEIQTRAGQTTRINGGEGDLRLVKIVGEGRTILDSGPGRMEALRASDGDEAITLRNGADMISLGRGTDTLDVLGGFVGSVLSYGGDTTLLLAPEAEIRAVGLSGGTDDLTLRGRASQVQTGGGDDAVRVQGTGEVGTLHLGDGDNVATLGGSFTEAVLAFGGNDTIRGGAGYVDFIGSGQGDDLIRVGPGGAGAINANDGADRIDARAAYVEAISAGRGADTVLIGRQGGGLVRLGDGDDLALIGPMRADRGVAVQGGGGTDTADFNAFGDGVTVSLNVVGRYQNVTAPGGTGDTGAGYVSLIQIDNLVGGRGGDVLRGDGGGNLLRGLAGADRLFGGGGRDRLFGGDQGDTLVGAQGNDILAGGNGNDRAFGGAGNDVWFDNGQMRFGDDLAVGGAGADRFRVGGGDDTLTGGAGADVFDFTRARGAETVTDYQLGVDALVVNRAEWQGRSEAVRPDGVLVDLGGGDTIFFAGLASLAGIENDVSFG